MNGMMLAELKPEHLQGTCDGNIWRVLLKGEGGLGKTTLAARIMQWALAGNPGERLCRDRQMLPIILNSEIKFDVRRDLTTFKNLVRARLRELVASETPIPEGLFAKLLVDRRILVVLDGLSEMPASPPGPGVANVQHPDFPANALLITSRDEEKEFGPKPNGRDRFRDHSRAGWDRNRGPARAAWRKTRWNCHWSSSNVESEVCTHGDSGARHLANSQAARAYFVGENLPRMNPMARCLAKLFSRH